MIREGYWSNITFLHLREHAEFLTPINNRAYTELIKTYDAKWRVIHKDGIFSRDLLIDLHRLMMESINCFFCSMGRPPFLSSGAKQQFKSPAIMMFSSAYFRTLIFKASKNSNCFFEVVWSVNIYENKNNIIDSSTQNNLSTVLVNLPISTFISRDGLNMIKVPLLCFVPFGRPEFLQILRTINLLEEINLELAPM